MASPLVGLVVGLGWVVMGWVVTGLGRLGLAVVVAAAVVAVVVVVLVRLCLGLVEVVGLGPAVVGDFSGHRVPDPGLGPARGRLGPEQGR